VAGRDRQAAARCRCSPASTPSGTLAHIGQTGHEHTWFVATKKIVEKEFALSGSEQNPDLTGKDVRLLVNRARAGIAAPVQEVPDEARTSSSPGRCPSWSPA
jgi:predicted oxidoreductase